MIKLNQILHHREEYARSIPSTDSFMHETYPIHDNTAVIYVHADSPEDLYQPLSWGMQKDLSDEVYSYLDDRIYYIPIRYDLEICFLCDSMNPETEQELKKMVQKHYNCILRDKILDERISNYKIIAMVLIGCFFLAISFAVDTGIALLNEFLSIAGTFALWEVVDIWFLEKKQIRTEKQNAIQSAAASVCMQREEGHSVS